MNERLKFMAAWQTDEWTMSEVCLAFNVSRKTGYKWLRRYEREGLDGLKERSRAPLRHSNTTPSPIEGLIMGTRHRYPHWGPSKLLSWLGPRHAGVHWPASSTVGEILKRHGLSQPRRRKRRSPPYRNPFVCIHQPNTVWTADFKGPFKTGQGAICYPLTVADAFSRYLLCCRGLTRPREVQVRPWFERVFREYGLPLAIRTDNGPPFASVGLGGLSKLSVWWLKLGILPERIQPGHPEQNGRHERMHRTLKEETARPPKASLRAQQRAFDRFRVEYNQERPHEALNQRPPACVYERSAREYPRRVPKLQYPSAYEVRKVRFKGELKWRGKLVYVSEALSGEPIGLHQIDDSHWQMYFGPVLLGVLDDRKGCIKRQGIINLKP